MKKILALALVSGLTFAATLPAFAAETGAKKSATAINGACMSTAVEKRDNAILVSLDAYTLSIKTALEMRRDVLKAAWLLTDKSAREAAIKAAHQAFQGTWKKAATALKSSRKSAWQAFKVDAKACKVPPTAAESSAESGDMGL